MNREIILTRDGSHSVALTGSGPAYHSRNGAITESMHVYINAGLRYMAGTKSTLRILEIGFGTGLNALLSMIETLPGDVKIRYTAIEPFPLPEDLIRSLNYCSCLSRPDLQEIFFGMHHLPWEIASEIHPGFILKKLITNAQRFQPGDDEADLIFFDAFSPRDQPSIWEREIFEKMFRLLSPGGVLVTYCSKGEVRRAMQASGLAVEKLSGPPGKREMIRASRPLTPTGK